MIPMTAIIAMVVLGGMFFTFGFLVFKVAFKIVITILYSIFYVFKIIFILFLGRSLYRWITK